MSTEIDTPIAETRMRTFKSMTPACQEVARDFEQKLGKAATGVVIVQYDMGARLKEVFDKEEVYGHDGPEKLAAYLGIPNGKTMLGNMMRFSQTFDKDYVKTNSLRQMANGQYMSLMHWIQLMKLADEKKREKMLTRIIKESLSAADLEVIVRSGEAGGTKHARQGGRKPKIPTSAITGLQVTYQLANKFSRWEEAAEKAVFDRLDEMPADKVTDVLFKKAEQTLEMVTTAAEKIGEMKDRLEKNVERLKEVMENQAEEAAAEYSEEEAEKPAKAKKAAKPSENGHAKKTKKLKKKAKAAAASEE